MYQYKQPNIYPSKKNSDEQRNKPSEEISKKDHTSQQRPKGNS